MTAQIQDVVKFDGRDYVITGVKGSTLPNPEQFGMLPVMMSTACYRGFINTYMVADGELFLTQMAVRSSNGYKSVDGVDAKLDERFGHATYHDLMLPVPFSGGMLIARDFIGTLYVHMGFQKATSYETVIELLLDNGLITQSLNHSKKIAKLRDDLAEWRKQSGEKTPPSQDDLRAWISQMFSLDYDL
jgi:hypothetical protein